MTPEDCDDGNPLIYPGAYEYVDDTDADCDGYAEGVDGTGFGGLGGFSNIGLVFGDPRLLRANLRQSPTRRPRVNFCFNSPIRCARDSSILIARSSWQAPFRLFFQLDQ